jgi:hypothetical protein
MVCLRNISVDTLLKGDTDDDDDDDDENNNNNNNNNKVVTKNTRYLDICLAVHHSITFLLLLPAWYTKSKIHDSDLIEVKSSTY